MTAGMQVTDMQVCLEPAVSRVYTPRQQKKRYKAKRLISNSMIIITRHGVHYTNWVKQEGKDNEVHIKSSACHVCQIW